MSIPPRAHYARERGSKYEKFNTLSEKFNTFTDTLCEKFNTLGEKIFVFLAINIKFAL